MGTTSPNTFYRWEVPPGQHVIVSYTQPPAVLRLKTEPGGVYYVWQDINCWPAAGALPAGDRGSRSPRA